MRVQMLWCLALGAALVGCASPERPPVGGGEDPLDFGEPPLDLGEDLRSDEEPDLKIALDLAAGDLAAGDQSVGSDLSTADLAAGDLALPSDLAKPVDLSTVDLIPPADLAPMCTPPVTGGLCDTAPQCGCPSGQACSVTNTTTGSTGCVASGTTPVGGTCTSLGAGQCQAGSVCVSGECSKYCEKASDCGAYHTCDGISNASGAEIPGALICSQLCNPVTPTDTTAPFQGCPSGHGCLPDSAGAAFCFGAVSTTAGQGATCTGGDQSLCKPGFVCLNDLLTYACYKMCRVASGNADCSSLGSGYTCYSFGTKQYAATTEIGYCD